MKGAEGSTGNDAKIRAYRQSKAAILEALLSSVKSRRLVFCAAIVSYRQDTHCVCDSWRHYQQQRQHRQHPDYCQSPSSSAPDQVSTLASRFLHVDDLLPASRRWCTSKDVTMYTVTCLGTF
ncbi:hypothetical protein LSTR_LSTR007021 [Laodelphax striatellus]|uniref:Uncharacterized protein n=1 Tax=Laodelphax striatellus TaxID=195883 RepID=A0A482WJJ0_LAOST|nr:hypothetical protein LSTR_LSTR007021 [Laodelphax striatellus]